MKRLLPVLLLASGFVCTACGYRLEGRVVGGGFGTLTLVDPNDDRLQAQGVAGVRVQLVRDPQRLSREVIATCSSGRDGSFALETKTFGAGLTDERWEVIATRPGYGTAQGPVQLPVDAGSRRLLIEIGRGNSDDAGAAPPSGSLYDEAQKYDPVIAPRKGGGN